MTLPALTLEQFRATKRFVDDLTTETGDFAPNSAPGYVYIDALWIAHHIEFDGIWRGWFWLAVSRNAFDPAEDLIRPHLSDLEERLYAFALEAGYCLAEPEDPADVRADMDALATDECAPVLAPVFEIDDPWISLIDAARRAEWWLSTIREPDPTRMCAVLREAVEAAEARL